MRYDPEIHHRRSIRLKGHDYAGGGVYFVTICAHRDAIAAYGGAPFGATQMSPVRALIEERMWITAEKFPQMSWGEWVIMPDHFHALIYLEKGGLRLGDVIGGFKAAVSREWNRAQASENAARDGVIDGATGATQVSPVLRRGEACLVPLWHRNYYEMIVRSAEAEQKIAGYIRMNPWRCVMDFGSGLRGIGNPALWNGEKLGVLCSRNAPKIGRIPRAEVYFGGWHSPKEKEILEWLLKNGRRVIACPAWGIEDCAFAPGVRDALEENRMLILEMRNCDGDLAAAEQRNRFVLECADELWLPYVATGGMLDRLIRELRVDEKVRA